MVTFEVFIEQGTETKDTFGARKVLVPTWILVAASDAEAAGNAIVQLCATTIGGVDASSLLESSSNASEILGRAVRRANELLGSIEIENAVVTRTHDIADFRLAARERDRKRIVFVPGLVKNMDQLDKLPVILATEVMKCF